jgi:hypothetical protein
MNLNRLFEETLVEAQKDFYFSSAHAEEKRQAYIELCEALEKYIDLENKYVTLDEIKAKLYKEIDEKTNSRTEAEPLSQYSAF